MSMEKLMKEEKKMTTDSHGGDLEEIHRRESKENGKQKRMNEEEYDQELTEIRRHLSLLMELLQKKEEDPCLGWKLKRKVNWYALQHKQRQKREGISRVESEKEVHICEPKQGVIHGQDDEDDEAMKPYAFKFNKLCVFAGYHRSNEGR